MEYTLDWLVNPEVFAVNRIAAHSDHKFYANLNEANSNISSLIQNLNGTWKFTWAKNPIEWKSDFYKENNRTDNFDNIMVPGHMELQGYGNPQYVNTIYPWEGWENLRPPFISEKDNPVGSYVRYFDLDDALKNKRVFISFQGVETAFYIWLNGEFVGYSEDSFTPSEFELTSFIRETNNKLAVAVFKRSSASWLEDQDFWRFSGIFRDVFLYAVPPAHLRDMKIIADYDDTNGILSAVLDIEGDCSVKSVLTDKNETVVAESNEKTIINRTIENLKPWSAEIPNLYTFTVILSDESGNEIEVSRTKVGFRRFELKNGIMCLNGKRIIFKGINRHEFNAKTGRAITEEDMLFDIQFMKKNNINAVRTCHYPNNSLWYQLCDEYGIYLIDEANLETHGTWQKLGETEPSWNIPGSLPEWKDAVLDRAKSMYERDKNHASVLIWSCGNESYCGEDIAAMSEYFRNTDPTRLVHYEGVTRVPNNQYDYITDMESRMYAKPQEIEEYLNQNTDRPYISCEYMHAMGNSLGGMSHYTDLEDKYEAYQGGFIWDYIDQAIEIKNDDGKTVLAYGGDFEDRPSDYGFCTNGVIYSDRTCSPKVQELKALYSNIRMTIKNGNLTVENRNLFADTSDLFFISRLEKNGVVLISDTFSLNIHAGERKTIKLELQKTDGEGEYIYHVSAVTASKTLWADAGHEIAFAYEIFKVNNNTIPKIKYQKPSVVYGDVIIGVHGKNFSMMFDKKEGGISSLKYHGFEYITRTPKVSFWRAMTDNDTGAAEPYSFSQWYTAGKFARYKSLASKEQEDSLKITFTYQAACIPTFEFNVSYTAYFDGKLGICVSYPGAPEMPDMPIFALDFKMKKQFHNFMYYGMGPDENYSDRCKGARPGLWKSTATDNLSGYLNPQECGNRTGVRSLTVSDDTNHGLTFENYSVPFEMSILPYSAYELENAMHMDELPNIRYTWVRIAAKQMGVGGDDSWGAPVHDEYRINPGKPMKLEFTIKPLAL